VHGIDIPEDERSVRQWKLASLDTLRRIELRIDPMLDAVISHQHAFVRQAPVSLFLYECNLKRSGIRRGMAIAGPD